MSVFVDTSALYIALDEDDADHAKVAAAVRRLTDEQLITHNYVIAESVALVERRLGRRFAGRLLRDLLAPVEVSWVDEATHEVAVRTYLASRPRGPSLVDCTSFAVMRLHGIRTALAVDRDFADAGFDVIPA